MEIKRETLINLLLYLTAVFFLIIPAIVNGYPLLFSDSGTYLSSGHTGYVPVDRPIIYGLFVRHISLSWSVWLVIIMQSILVNYLLFLLSKFVIKAKRVIRTQFMLSAFLAAFTGIGYYCSLVIADIFTPISILSVFFLMMLPKREKLHLVLLSLILLISIITHLSHIPLIVGLVAFVVVYYFFFNKKQLKEEFKRICLVAGVTLTSLLTISTVNYSYGGGVKISRTNNIILATRYIESGLANRFLKKNCDSPVFNPPYKELCAYIDQFDQWPAAGIYLPNKNSPLYLGDCINEKWTTCGIEKNDAYGQLVKDILADPEIRKDFIALIFTGTLKQLFTFEQSPLDPVDLRYIIDRHFKDDLYQYEHSNQVEKRINFQSSSLIEAIVFDISLILVLLIIVKFWANRSQTEKLLVVITILSLIVNALITATLLNVTPRYQGRILFLLPLCLVVIGINRIKKRKTPIILEF